MHPSHSALLVVALVTSTAVVTASGIQPGQSQPKGAAASEKATKLTGCLQEADDTAIRGGTSAGGAATSPSGSPTTSGSGGTQRYVLAVVDSDRGSATTAGKDAAGAKKLYALTAPETVGLAKHLNHQIEVTGTLSARSANESPAGSGAGGAPGTTGAASGASARTIAGTIDVSAIKMISAKCPSTP